MKLSLADARKIQLHSQGLRTRQPFGAGKAAVVSALQKIGYVQIDTISVVQRAHHHVIWSRVPDYQLSWLHDLQAHDKEIFEYWSHAAAYLPIKDFRFCLPRMMRFRNGEKHWWEKDKKMIKFVFDQIQKNGPMLARDFENTSKKKSGPWFDRTPAKKALEYLFQEGRLVISERRGFQKLYEVADRFLPKDIDKTLPTEKEFARHLIERSLLANGVSTAKEIAYLRKGLAPVVLRALGELENQKLVKKVSISGMKEDFYCLSDLEVPKQKPNATVHILSPFDNLVIQRQRLKNFFDFDYQIECYVPEPKRKFGYFVLPVLLGDEFVCRIDAKADRPNRKLIIKAVHFEKNVTVEQIAQPFCDGLKRFADFNSCPEIDFQGLQAKHRRLFEKQL